MNWITLQKYHFLSQYALDLDSSLIFIENHGNPIVETEIHGCSSLEENSKDQLFHICDLRQGQTLSKSFLTCDWLSRSQNSARAEGDFMLTKAECRGDSSGWLKVFSPDVQPKENSLNQIIACRKATRIPGTWHFLLCRCRVTWQTPSVLSCALDFQDNTLIPLQDNLLRIRWKK